MAVSRRVFLGGIMSAGALTGSVLLASASARAASDDDERDMAERCRNNAAPNPIPGGVAPFAPFGTFVHHNPLNPAIALADINDPSQITDFDGVVGLTHIRGGGTGTNTVTGETMSLAYQADMGFSQGRFISTDGQVHQGTFAFVWLDLYNGPVGSASLITQIHDFNVHIDSNDVFWMVPLRPGAVSVDFSNSRASLIVSDRQVFDDHDVANSLTLGLGLPGDLGFPYPKISPVFPVRATVSFDVEWDGSMASAQIRNIAQQFEGAFLQTGATIEWSAEEAFFS